MGLRQDLDEGCHYLGAQKQFVPDLFLRDAAVVILSASKPVGRADT